MVADILETFANTLKSLFYGTLTKKSLIEKGDIINSASRLIDDIDANILPALKDACDLYFMELNQVKVVLPDLAKNMKQCGKEYDSKVPGEHKGKNTYTFYVAYLILNDLVVEKDRILNVLSNNLQQFIGGPTTRIKDMSIINFLDAISYVNDVLFDLLIFAVYAGNREEKQVSRKGADRVFASVGTLPENLAKLTRNSVDAYLKKLPKVSTIEISKVEGAHVDDVINAAKENREEIIENGLSNFVYNPIYHIRLWMADREHAKFKHNKLRREIVIGKIMAIREGTVETHKDKNEVIDALMTELAELEKKITDYQKSVL